MADQKLFGIIDQYLINILENPNLTSITATTNDYQNEIGDIMRQEISSIGSILVLDKMDFSDHHLKVFERKFN